MEKFTFFWRGPFSQWHHSPFEIQGIHYNCAEQFMMAAKARLFDDDVILARIMGSSDPREQKKLGRQVQGFVQKTWDGAARGLVETGSFAKFDQNPDLKEALLATTGTTLVEASPYDRIWGIGLMESDPRAQDRSTWLGTNWLGEVLTEVRDKMLAG